MATTRLDTAYSTFITQVATQFDNMSREEVTELLSDITKRMDYEIDCKKESEIYSEAREQMQKERNTETLSDEEVKAKNAQDDIMQGYEDDGKEEKIEEDDERFIQS